MWSILLYTTEIFPQSHDNVTWLADTATYNIVLYYRQFFHLQLSLILITLILTNGPSPTLIPTHPASFRLAHNSQTLLHNCARLTIFHIVTHPFWLPLFQFIPPFPLCPSSSIQHSLPCLESTTTPLSHSIIQTLTICNEWHHMPITISHDHSSYTSARDSSSIVPHVIQEHWVQL